LEQNLSQVYLPSSTKEYQVGDRVFLPNVGDGYITYIGISDDVTKYTVNFNPRETYTDLTYEVKILKIRKK